MVRSLGPSDLILAIVLMILSESTGSVKLSSTAYSELLRHLSLLVETVAEKPEQDESVARTYLLVATFLDGVCADRVSLEYESYFRLHADNWMCRSRCFYRDSTSAASFPSFPAFSNLLPPTTRPSSPVMPPILPRHFFGLSPRLSDKSFDTEKIT